MSRGPNFGRLGEYIQDPDTPKKWYKFQQDVGKGTSFGDRDVERALKAGYTLDDVNGYLKWSGITPSGNFAVGGFNKETVGSGAGDGSGVSTKETPYYRFLGPTTPTAPAPAPAPVAADPSPPPVTSAPSVAPGNPSMLAAVAASAANPELSIPDSIRLTSESLGIKAKVSSSRKSGQINRGTSRLTIPRSSGYQPLNFGS